MRVVDMSAWIEWLIDSPAGLLAAQHFPIRNDWIVPTMVQFELTKWAGHAPDRPPIGGLLAFMQHCVVVDFDTPIVLEALRVNRDHKLATADSIIYATARHYDAELVTCDAHFQGLPGVIYIRKLAS